MSDPEEPLVPNPVYTDLQQLRNALDQVAPDIGDALSGAMKELENGAWRGRTTATAFEAELDGHHRWLRDVVETILGQIDTRMQNTEAEVPESEATALQMLLDGNRDY
ncbi:hypothetical protein [Phytoactinopolyspora mesophila]|uniref:WXG100 family type VII secretion target n=1 Tax=Phytoactinopolyspora mesophila TaxID=2650750 RepID=A0A7K3LXC6_9ACTN|nr:hypothetical protein [Phytoactinopolyspora mesophila]NDL55684.1 hypothetical protein [Phytoactinopolyspora mesophila]